MDNYFTKKEQIVILVLALLIVFILGFKFLNSPNEEFEIKRAELEEDTSTDLELISTKEALEEAPEEEPDEIMIHISGQVYNPGLIKLELGKRLIDAVELAGGLKKEADLDKINLAKKLQDEDKVYIPKIGEAIDAEIQTLSTSSEDVNSNLKAKININKCTKEELVSLPGIGEATAGKILDYRSNNSFKTIEDIMDVSGIGEKKFSSIKELITVR